MQMGHASTNNTSLSYAIETSTGVASTQWKLLQPNAIGSFSANIETVERNPISKNRQRLKGTIVNLTSNPSFDSDLTIEAFRDFIEGFMFARSINGDIADLTASAASSSPVRYTVETLDASQQLRLTDDSLVWVTGFASAGNNGLKQVVSSAATTVTVEGSLTAESSTVARLAFAGFRFNAGSTVSWTWDAGNKQATLAGVTGVGTNLTALGLRRGQLVHIGSVATVGGAYQNGFQNSVANAMVGYARVAIINANSIVFEQVDTALQFTDASIATAVDILFTEFIRNVAVDDANFIQRSYTMEGAFDNLDSTNETHYTYSIGAHANELTLDVGLNSLATMSMGFVGTNTLPPVKVADRKSGAATPKLPVKTAGFSSQADFARLRLTDVDEDGLTTFFTNMTVSLNNNINAIGVLNKLGAQFITPGNFNVDIDTEVVFTNPDVLARIRNNTRVKFDLIMRNDDAVFSIFIPSMTLGGGDLQLPENDVVRLAVTGQAYIDEILGISAAISLIAVPLPQLA
jgi:hypothetical protein